jgi:Kef-type K+ transport system membrane component KefB
MAGVHGDEILEAVMFLFICWLFGRPARAANLSPVLGEIAAGVAMGPEGLDLVPFVPSGASGARRLAGECGVEGETDRLNPWSLMGNMGVALMTAESGMHLNFAKTRLIGTEALAVAIAGAFLPLLCGVVLIAGWR